MRITYIYFLCLWTSMVSAQTGFELGSSTFASSTFPMAVADVNGDLLDDVVSLSDREIHVYYQMVDGSFADSTIAYVQEADPFLAVVVADFDQNGMLDIVATSESTPPYIFYQKEGEWTTDLAGFDNIYSQSATAIDADQDGWLDLFVCNDIGLSQMYKNHGSYLDSYTFVDMQTQPASDNSGNYSVVWLDVEQDGDLDLYLGKCRAGVDDPQDPRRVNTLYINDDGQFREAAADYGIDIGLQTWSATAADIDNDGDEDLLITNHYATNQILINHRDTFHIMDLPGIAAAPFQGLLADFDGNGWLDILIMNDGPDLIYYQEAPLSFRLDSTALGSFDRGISATLGDLNADGRPDIISARANGQRDIALVNTSTSDFRSIYLRDQHGSPAIGAQIYVHTPSHTQYRMVRSGESYGVSTSATQYIGLGGESLDSITVQWPDGQRRTYTDLPNSPRILLYQDGCIGQATQVIQNVVNLCDGETANLDLTSLGYSATTWSTGDSSPQIDAAPGQYTARLLRADGCYDHLLPIQVRTSPALSLPIITASNYSICNGQGPTLSSPLLHSQWQNGDTTQQITATASQWYTLTGSDACNRNYSDSLYLPALSSSAVDDLIDTVRKGETYLFEIMDTTTYLRDTETGRLLGRAQGYRTPPLDTLTTYILENRSYGTGQTTAAGISEVSQSFASAAFNSGIVFTAHQDLRLQSITVYTEEAGPRVFQIWDDAGHLHYEAEVAVGEGQQVVKLNAFIEAGTYTLQTDAAFNQGRYGHAGPGFSRSNTNINFPYEVSGVLSLLRTLNGESNYYYFYDWQVEHSIPVCVSEPATATIAIRNGVSTQDISDDDWSLYPNPVRDYLYLRGVDATRWQVRDMQGRVMAIHTQGLRIDVSQLASGSYVLTGQSRDAIVHKIFIKLP